MQRSVTIHAGVNDGEDEDDGANERLIRDE